MNRIPSVEAAEGDSPAGNRALTHIDSRILPNGHPRGGEGNSHTRGRDFKGLPPGRGEDYGLVEVAFIWTRAVLIQLKLVTMRKVSVT